MYSIKPGRGPSLMGVVGGAAAVVIGIGWTVMAMRMGAPGFFALFGVVFVLVAVAGVVYNLANATQKNRMSSFDVTTGREEPDPIARALGHAPREPGAGTTAAGGADREGDGPTPNFCPSCGAQLQPGDEYCRGCGRNV